ncbi:uncharacterized protein LOC144547828 [Carex rostrata]
MDLLARALDNSASVGELTGVKVAPRAKAITSCIYADDLLLLGAATQHEAETVMGTLYAFAAVSGQKVGPEKSHIWYSKAVSESQQIIISQILQVPLGATTDMYLGAPIQTGRVTFDFLIEKVSAKLQVWKSRLLSPAGRLVLIKAVLLSIPIYYMATTFLPQSVINTINGLVRRFFWGAGDKSRYLAYISWDTITKPKEEGGLAVRDLKAMNEAMLLKALWKIAAGSDAMWVQMVVAKYIPRSKLWTSKRTYNCTPFWRAIMKLRTLLLPMIKWCIGDGEKCEVFGQPWCPEALCTMPQNVNQRDITISELTGQEEDTWDVNRLIDLFGMQGCVRIISALTPPKPQAGEDKLIFTQSTNGSFQVKDAYSHIRGLVNLPQEDPTGIWRLIWKRGKAVPRVRLFVWKLIQNGLPLNMTIASRTSQGDPTCPSCSQGDENPLHLIFNCSFARSCWFGSPLAIMSDALDTDGTVKSAFINLAAITDKESWTEALNTCWAIWRTRNDKAYAGKSPTFQQFSKYLSQMRNECTIAFAGDKVRQVTPRPATQDSGFNCMTDGSWISNWKGGLGFVLRKGDTLVAAKSKGVRACCPIQAEAQALLDAIQFVSAEGIDQCVFRSDCEVLVNLCSSLQPPIQTDWRAFKEVQEIWERLKRNQRYSCEFLARCHNELADLLARKGTKEDWEVMAYTYPLFNFDS